MVITGCMSLGLKPGEGVQTLAQHPEPVEVQLAGLPTISAGEGYVPHFGRSWQWFGVQDYHSHYIYHSPNFSPFRTTHYGYWRPSKNYQAFDVYQTPFSYRNYSRRYARYYRR